jgi:hypothetical protein
MTDAVSNSANIIRLGTELQRVRIESMILNVKGGAYYSSEAGRNGAERLSPKNCRADCSASERRAWATPGMTDEEPDEVVYETST